MLSFPSKRSAVSFANSEANFLNLSESSQAMILKPSVYYIVLTGNSPNFNGSIR